MTEVRYNKNHHAGSGPEQRIASRLRNSGAGAKPNVTTKQGESPQRVFHNIHNAGHPIAPGTLPYKDAGR
jgi:hypothetical protein